MALIVALTLLSHRPVWADAAFRYTLYDYNDALLSEQGFPTLLSALNSARSHDPVSANLTDKEIVQIYLDGSARYRFAVPSVDLIGYKSYLGNVYGDPEPACREAVYDPTWPNDNFAGMEPYRDWINWYECHCYSNPGGACAIVEPACPYDVDDGWDPGYHGTTDGKCASNVHATIQGTERVEEENLGDGMCPPLAGNPFNAATGNKVLRETDVRGPDGVIEWTRVYNSMDSVDGELGFNWSSPYHLAITFDTFTYPTAIIERPDGRELFFEDTSAHDEPTRWEPRGGQHGELERLLDADGNPQGWRYTRPDGAVEAYGADGRLSSITRAGGRTATVTYDGATGRLSRVETDTGAFIAFGYDGDGRIRTVTDQAGRQWQYEYQSGELAQVVYPDATPSDDTDNPRRTYHYDEPAHTSNTGLFHLLTGITDERGVRYATFEYYADSRVKASSHAGGAGSVAITYDDENGTRTLTNGRDHSSTYQDVVQNDMALVTDIDGPGCAECASGETSYEYDPATNDLLAKTKAGRRTEYGDYDAWGHPGFIVEAAGTTEARRIELDYDPRFPGKVTERREPSVYAGAQKVTRTVYDDHANPESVTVSGYRPDGTPVSRTTTYEYNGPLNQITKVDGPRTAVADVVTYDYWPDDPAYGADRARLNSVTGPEGRRRWSIRYTPTGKVDFERRPGLILDYVYYPGNDRLERLIEEDVATGIQRVTRWTYLATGEVETVTVGHGSADATTVTFGYDDARRLTRITDGLGNYIEYTLDPEGNRTAEKTYDPGGALARSLTRTFDAYNRLDTTQQANETTDPDFAPDGTLDQETDGRGSVTDYGYDALKRLTRITRDVGGTDPATADSAVGYGYDAADRLTRVTDPNDNDTTYVYDDLGNRLSTTSPDTGTTTYAHDAAGNVKSKTDAKGQTFTYTYDALDRLESIDGPGTEADVTYAYDACPHGQGRLCEVSRGGETIRYVYDAFGGVARHQGVRYGFDAAGRTRTITYPSGATVTLGHDAAGQVESVDLTTGGTTQSLASGIAHRPLGPLAGLTFGNGLSLSQSHDQAYRLTVQTVPGVLELDYPQYDANGNLESRAEAVAGTGSTFGYDPLDRLTSGDGAFGSRGYDYDPNGNRLTLTADGTDTPYAYEPASNRLDSVGSQDVVLDANGNTTTLRDLTLAYTPDNRLASASDASGLLATYAYNGLGQRQRKTFPDSSGRIFLYGTNGQLLAETTLGGHVLREYVYLEGTPLAVHLPDSDGDGQTNVQESEAGTLGGPADSDGDGIADTDEWFVHGTDSLDADTDSDGVNDGDELTAGTDPLSAAEYPGDGDVNQDGVFNIVDILFATQIATGVREGTPDEITHADANRDGVVNAADVLLLQRQLHGLDSAMSGAANDEGETMLAETAVAAAAPGGSVAPVPRTPTAARSVLDFLISPAKAAAGTGEIYYVHADHLGTPRVLTDATGAVVWRAEYDPFGKATVDADPDGDGMGVTFNVRFPGQYEDRETGLHYNYFRDYAPESGRYLESDPIGVAGGLNTYLYANANAMRYTDPVGESAIAWTWPIAGGAAAADGPFPIGDAVGAALLGGALIYDMCRDKECPPCKTVSGKIVPVGTVGYRPLDTPPPGKIAHGIDGPHYNIYKANQNPKNCQCFWQPQGAVPPSSLPPGAIPIEPFAN